MGVPLFCVYIIIRKQTHYVCDEVITDHDCSSIKSAYLDSYYTIDESAATAPCLRILDGWRLSCCVHVRL